MQAYFSVPGGVGRGAALKALREDLAGLVGEPVRTHDANFADVPLADFFATSETGRLYAIQWIDASDFSAVLTRTLGAYVRFHATGRDQACRTFGLRPGFPPATLILVCNRVEEDWASILSTLSIPLILIRAHALIDGNREAAGCLFENRYSSGQSSETIARFLPRVGDSGAIASPASSPSGEGEADEAHQLLSAGSPPNAEASRLSEPGEDRVSTEPTSNQSEDEPEEAATGEPDSPAPSPRFAGAEGAWEPERCEPLEPEEWVDEAILKPTGLLDTSLKDGLKDGPESGLKAGPDSGEVEASEEQETSLVERMGLEHMGETPRGTEHAWDTPAELLTDEETATFRLLENVLNN